MAIRILLPALFACGIGASAQEPAAVGPRLLAHGVDGESGPRPSPTPIEDAAALGQAWARCGGGHPIPAIDWARERAWLVPLGRGRGGEVTITQVLRGRGLLVRLEGVADSEPADGRWALVAVARAWDPRDVAFEADSDAGSGRIAFRVSAVQGLSCAPRVVAPMREPVVLQVFTDALAYADFRRVQGMPADDTDGIDFAKVALLVAPVARWAAVEQTEQTEQADRLDVYQAPGLCVVRLAREVQAGDPAGKFAEPMFGVHILPRVPGELQVDAPLAADAHVVRRVAGFAVADQSRAPKLPVLRYRTFEVAALPATVCERVQTPAAFRELRARDPAIAALPADFCTFDGSSIVFVATAAGHVWPGFEFAVTEEEGVDVVTATQFAPSGEDPGLHSYAFVAVVPDRMGQLAIVLRDWCVGPQGEKTLRVFPGNGR